MLIPPAGAAELKVFGSRVTKMVVGDLGPGYAQASGNTLTVVTDVAAVMKRRIEQGEPFDLAVLVNFQADDLIRQGKLVADSRADVMKSGIGVAVRRGAPKPDISTVAAFKQTLLDAKSITYLKEGASTLHLVKVLAELGIADALAAKTIKPTTEAVSEMGRGRRGRDRHDCHPQHSVGAGRRAGRSAAAGDPVLCHLHGRRVGAVAQPGRRARGDQADAESRRRRVDQGERDG